MRHIAAGVAVVCAALRDEGGYGTPYPQTAARLQLPLSLSFARAVLAVKSQGVFAAAAFRRAGALGLTLTFFSLRPRLAWEGPPRGASKRDGGGIVMGFKKIFKAEVVHSDGR